MLVRIVEISHTQCDKSFVVLCIIFGAFFIMWTSLSLPIAKLEANEKYQKICEEHTNLIETIPKGNGWRVQTLYNYNGFWLNPHNVKNNLILHAFFNSQPSDIFLASFMKSGTTWFKALMFSILNRDRYTFTEHYLSHNSPQSAFPFLDSETYPITDFTQLPTPRLFATHSAYTLLPSSMTSCKFVYVFREPKDVLVSKWLFMSSLRSEDLPPLTLEEAFRLFCQGVSEYGPFWEHVLSYWRASLEFPNKILFLKYEDMKNQPRIELGKLADFMGKSFTKEEEEEKGVVEEIIKLCSFEHLSNLEVNKKGVEKFGNLVEVEKSKFFRKGEMGDWKNYLSEEMKGRIDEITNKKFSGSGLISGPSV